MKYLIIENVRSAYNVGAMFRTADGAGFSKVFLIGYTPAPIDRFGRVQAEISKTSLGAPIFNSTSPYLKPITGDINVNYQDHLPREILFHKGARMICDMSALT